MIFSHKDPRDPLFQELYAIALSDPRVMLLSADAGALMLKEFERHIPEQFFYVGIAEQNAISVAAGLALTGRHVFVFGISNFVTLRCLEQIRVDVCCMKLPVTIIGMGTGYGYSADGPTHHITEDVAVMRALPEMTIWSPSDHKMIAAAARLAYETTGPGYIRFDKGPFDDIYETRRYDFHDGLAVLKEGKDLTVVATGIMVTHALKVVAELERQGVKAGLIDLYRLKPVNKDLLAQALEASPRVVTLEEHTTMGGLGSIVLESLAQKDMVIPVKVFGIPDVYRSEVGSRDMLRSLDGIDVAGICRSVSAWGKGAHALSGRRMRG